MEKPLIGSEQLPPIDFASAYFGKDFRLNEFICIHQPTIDEIIEYGEKEYWRLINTLTIISSDMKSEFWDAGKYWGDVSDFETFYLVVRSLPVSQTRIVFGDNIDFTKFGWYKQKSNDLFCMADIENGIKIDELLYAKMVKYISAIHGIEKKPEFAGNAITREYLIDEDRRNKKRAKSSEYKSTLFPLSSFLSSENKLTPSQIRDMKIFYFLDTIKRTCAINSSNLLLTGIYAGKVDGEKVNKKMLDSMRDLYTK